MKRYYALRCIFQTFAGGVVESEKHDMAFGDDIEAFDYGKWRFGRYDSETIHMLYLSLTDGDGVVVFERTA